MPHRTQPQTQTQAQDQDQDQDQYDDQGSRDHEPAAASVEFAMSFTATPRGARLARMLVSRCLDTWGYPYDSRVSEDVTLIAAELCANAVRHGRVPGRDFHVRLTREAAEAGPLVRLRLEVSDTVGERRPPADSAAASRSARPLDECGRGLLLVGVLAESWGVADRRRGGPGKTVWVTYAVGAES